MKPQERSLRRLVGLGKKSGTSVSYQGGIDHLQPGQFSGWVVAEGVNLLEVRLLVGDHLIAKGEINQQRPDVNEKLGWHGAAGFCVELPSALPIVNWQDSPRVIALSADGSKQVELGLLGKKQQTREIFRTLLQSDLLGLVGHCDGLVQGQIRGWAARRNQTRPAQIWLQCHGQEATPVVCNLHRGGMQTLQLSGECGFSIDPQTLPDSYQGKAIHFSFDRDSFFPLPQPEPVVLHRQGYDKPKSSEWIATIENRSSPNAGNNQPLEHTPDELSMHWQRLESFRRLLDSIEAQNIRIDQPAPMRLNQIETTPGQRFRKWLTGGTQNKSIPDAKKQGA